MVHVILQTARLFLISGEGGGVEGHGEGREEGEGGGVRGEGWGDSTALRRRD